MWPTNCCKGIESSVPVRGASTASPRGLPVVGEPGHCGILPQYYQLFTATEPADFKTFQGNATETRRRASGLVQLPLSATVFAPSARPIAPRQEYIDDAAAVCSDCVRVPALDRPASIRRGSSQSAALQLDDFGDKLLSRRVSFREGCVGFQWAACVAGFTRMNSTSHWMCLPEAVGRPPGKI